MVTFILLYQPSSALGGSIDPALGDLLRGAPSEQLFPIIVRLRETVDHVALHVSEAREDRHVKLARVIHTLRDKATMSQKLLKTDLENRENIGAARNVKPFWIFNGFALSATADTISTIAARDDVASVAADRVLRFTPAPTSSVVSETPQTDKVTSIMGVSAVLPATSTSWNLDLIGARALWQQGYRGQGVVVANLDTGVDISHPALSKKWRGGTNSWFDPYKQTTIPYDADGHGTGTMGVMVAGNTNDNPVGVAPGALWIAAKIFDDSGNGSLSVVHQAFQWVLNPDGNPSSADAPDVVNNSWDLGNTGNYDGEFEVDIQNLRTAGISVVFAAGNSGPTPSSSISPGNNPGAFPVGATDSNDLILPFSSRGPSAFDGSTFPSIMAPGAHVRSTDLNAAYSTYTNNGTSYAAPHVSGAIALLLSGRPSSLIGRADVLQEALTSSARDLGPVGPDNAYGYGRLDIVKAVTQLALQPPPGPSGDVNGDGVVDILDAMIMLQATVGLIPVTPRIMQQGDIAPLVNNVPSPDGVINIFDTLLIFRKVVGLETF